MKKLILTVGIAALFIGTTLIADSKPQNKDLAIMSLIVVQDGVAVGCMGYGATTVLTSANVDVTYKKHRIVTTCNLEYQPIDEELSGGKGFMCLISDITNNTIKHGHGLGYKVTTDGDVTINCVFRGKHI